MCEDHFTKDLQNLAENDDECISRADRSPTFLNLLSTAFKTFRLGCPCQPSFIFSSLFPEISKYSSFGKLNGGNSVNLLPYKSRYFRF